MGVAASQLETQASRDVLDAEEPRLLGDLGVKKDLEEDVAQLVFDLVRRSLAEGLGELP